MSKALRIDSVVVANGIATIGVTYGDSPLATAADPQGFNLPVAQIKAMAQGAENSDLVSKQLLFLLALCAYAHADPTFANPQLAVGHSVTLSLVGVAPVITIA